MISQHPNQNVKTFFSRHTAPAYSWIALARGKQKETQKQERVRNMWIYCTREKNVTRLQQNLSFFLFQDVKIARATVPRNITRWIALSRDQGKN